MISGRYPTDRLRRHWSENKNGNCSLPSCRHSNVYGTLEHLLLLCPSLQNTRDKLFNLLTRITFQDSVLSGIINEILQTKDSKLFMQLLLDCTALPAVILATQIHGNSVRDSLIHFGRTWCYSVHRERMTQLGLLKFR